MKNQTRKNKMPAQILNPHNGKAVSSIALGSRVVLKGDLGSPVMTTFAPILPPNNESIVGWVCGWFNTTYSQTPGTLDAERDYTANMQWNQIQLPLECLELATEDMQ
jgi:hypothetical protein